MRILVLAAALLCVSAYAQQLDPKTAASTAEVKALVIEVTIPASLDAVWEAFSTSAGLSTWLTPGATVDLRPGGEWTARFPGASTGGGTIISFVPKKELVLAALAPDRFPTVRAQRTRAVFHFEARGNGTVVRMTQTGWQSGAEWDRAYEYLAGGNGQLLGTLYRRFVDGPIDWQKEWGLPAKAAPVSGK
jgi:uncharacterized protein YndB with AHSA1/START domain